MSSPTEKTHVLRIHWTRPTRTGNKTGVLDLYVFWHEIQDEINKYKILAIDEKYDRKITKVEVCQIVEVKTYE